MSQPTWNEPLTSLDSVVAYTVVSTGENDSLFVRETQIVSHICPQSKGEMGLSNYCGHFVSGVYCFLTDLKIIEKYKSLHI